MRKKDTQKTDRTDKTDKTESKGVFYDYGRIVGPLLDWYDWNARILPWRQDPKPYYVWISEIMLQQTRVEAVKPYYDRFLNELPTIADLAKVSDDRLMKLWEGLGYYNRAKNLKIAAGTIMKEYGGKMPASYEALQSLKGIGSYTAGAIASIAFGIQAPAVDGNVLRVAMRLENCYDDIAKAAVKRRLEQELSLIIPADRAGDFNQSLIELGATVCIPNGRPLCDKCPLMPVCLSYHMGTSEELPVKAKKKARTVAERTIFVFQYGDCYAIRKREEKGLLSGLWEFPGVDGRLGIIEVERVVQQLVGTGPPKEANPGREITETEITETEITETELTGIGHADIEKSSAKQSSSERSGSEKNGSLQERITSLGEARHIFSHVEWQMQGYLIRLTAEEAGQLSITAQANETEFVKNLLWVTSERLKEEYSIPSAFRAYIQW